MAKISLQEETDHERRGYNNENNHHQMTDDITKKDDGDDDTTLKQKTTTLKKTTIFCDAGYGLPREKRPRQEKINAICNQLSNFIRWQLRESSSSLESSSSSSESSSSTQQKQQQQIRQNLCSIRIVGCCDMTMKLSLEKRLLEHLGLDELPSHVTISCDGDFLPSSSTFTTTTMTIESVVVAVPPSGTTSHPSLSNDHDGGECCHGDDVVYLSPDAEEALDPTQIPPSTVIVGLIIDRRVQPDRSLNRASSVNIRNVKRWPFDSCFVNINKNEPLNVDCIMEGMQQWWWNIDKILQQKQIQQQQGNEVRLLKLEYREAFIQATSQALEHHADRHPSRSLHK